MLWTSFQCLFWTYLTNLKSIGNIRLEILNWCAPDSIFSFILLLRAVWIWYQALPTLPFPKFCFGNVVNSSAVWELVSCLGKETARGHIRSYTRSYTGHIRPYSKSCLCHFSVFINYITQASPKQRFCRQGNYSSWWQAFNNVWCLLSMLRLFWEVLGGEYTTVILIGLDRRKWSLVTEIIESKVRPWFNAFGGNFRPRVSPISSANAIWNQNLSVSRSHTEAIQ